MQKYKIVKSIGDGSFGVVFKAIAPNNQIVAIKKMKSKYKNWQDCNILKEIKCLRKLEHENIVKLQEVILANNQLYLVFDYLETNLFQVYTRAHQSNRTLTENEIKSMFFKIASGVAYLHKNGFFHRDMKPENILVHNNEVKICDFGLAREIRSRPPFTDYVSTRWYRAPELLLRGTYNSPVDIFALACIIIELYMMAPLFPGQNEIETLNKIVQVLGTPKKTEWPQGYKLASTLNYNFPEKKKKQLSDLIPNASLEAIDLLQSMLSYSSRKRPSAAEILKHEFFNSINNISEEKSNDIKSQTKFSFYQKNIIDIPSNIPVENNKEMEMRKSLIKFGNSFTSSFHLSKEEKLQKKQKREREKINQEISLNQLEYIIESPKEEKYYKNTPKTQKNKLFTPVQHDEIAKKFDQMEQILLELQKKQKQQKKYETESFSPTAKRKSQSPNYLPSNEEQKMPVFTFGGIGMNSFASLNAFKNQKNPVFNKSSNNTPEPKQY